jgi:hypothetical protein
MTSTAPLPEWIRERIRRESKRKDRAGIARFFEDIFGVHYSRRTIEARPYNWQIINGKATADLEEATTDEWSRINASPKYRVASKTKKETA